MTLGPQLHISKSAQLIEVVPTALNHRHTKPQGGFWTSSYADGTSGWAEWCESEEFSDPRQQNWFVLYPSDDARIIHIDSLNDLKALLDTYGHVRLYSGGRQRYPDFEKLAKHCDAVHLTETGQWATRLSEDCDLYGWDCESTLWFRWKFERVERIPTPERKEEQAA